MKRALILILLLISTVTLVAQSQNESFKTSRDTMTNRSEHDVGWVRAHMLDNLTFDISTGGVLYFGYEDSKGKLKDRITPNIEAHLGRWLFPMLGYRLGGGFGTAHGFISKESYLNYRPTIISASGYGTCWGTTEDVLYSGNDTIVGSLGGYYWPVDGNDNVFMQKWRYIYGGIDVMLDLSNFKYYKNINFNKPLHHLVYAGAHLRIGLSEKHPQILYFNTNFAAEGHIGYMPVWGINKHWNLYADARLSLVEGLFDREMLEGIEVLNTDLIFNLNVGVRYDFNLRSPEQRLRYYVEKGILPYSTAEVPKNIMYVQVQDVDIVQIFDTLTIIRYDTINDVVTLNIIDTLIHTRDSLINRVHQINDDTPFDSILLKRLLPYEMVFFDRDKWFIRANEAMKIDKMARIIKAYPNQKFLLIGAADSKTGTVKRNEFLSHRRADIVRDKLVLEYGIPESQLQCEYPGGILDYDPFELNRTCIIIMDHPVIHKAFEQMKAQRRAGGNVIEMEY